jgi:predicted phosphodiesterase
VALSEKASNLQVMPGSFDAPASLVAALYDVHGNLPALDAVLAEVDAASPDVIVFGGDIALGPMPREVLERILALGSRARCLRGNCDRLMVDAFDGRLSDRVPAIAREPIEWAAGQLSRDQRDFLAALPPTITIQMHSLGAVLFCHATPSSDEPIFTEKTPEARVRTLLGEVAEGVVVCGHTHAQFRRRLDALEIVNAGSVGMPYGDAGAHWLELGETLEHRRTAYDQAAAARLLERSSFPNAHAFVERQVLHHPPVSEMFAAFEPGPS